MASCTSVALHASRGQRQAGHSVGTSGMQQLQHDGRAQVGHPPLRVLGHLGPPDCHGCKDALCSHVAPGLDESWTSLMRITKRELRRADAKARTRVSAYK